MGGRERSHIVSAALLLRCGWADVQNRIEKLAGSVPAKSLEKAEAKSLVAIQQQDRNSSFLYDDHGLLLSVTLPRSRFIQYSYDPLGRRIAKNVDGTVVKQLQCDCLWQ